MKIVDKTNLWDSIKDLFRRGETPAASAMTAAAKRADTTARIDAMMALPIKERSLITLVGDDGVSGFNPPPKPSRDEA